MLVNKELTDTWRILALLPLLLYLLLAPLLPLLNFSEIFDAGTEIPLFDWQRVLGVFALILSSILFGLGLGLTRQRCTVSVRNLCLFLYCFGSGAVAILMSPDVQREAWREWLMFYLSIGVCWGAMQLKSDTYSQLIEVVLIVVLGSALCYLAWLIFFNFNNNWQQIPFEAFRFPGFANVRMFGDWQSFVLPFFPLVIVHYCRGQFVRGSAFAIASVFYALAFVSASRGVILAQMLAHLSLLLVLRKSYIRCFVVSVVLWGSGLLLYFVAKAYVLPLEQGFAVAEGAGRSVSAAALTDTSGRQQLWMQAIDLANQSPIFGIGPGRFAMYPNSIAAAPHNAFLSIATEWGWPVAMALTAMLVWSLWQMGQAFARQYASSSWGSHKETDVRLVAYFLAIVLFVESMISTNVILGPVSLVCLIFVIALLLAGHQSEEHGALMSFNWFSGVTALIAPALIWGGIVLPDFLNTVKRNEAYGPCLHLGQNFAPRFWQQGWLIYSCAGDQS